MLLCHLCYKNKFVKCSKKCDFSFCEECMKEYFKNVCPLCEEVPLEEAR